MKYKILFNFSASRIGGGYKRLYEYSKYFNNKNGAFFIIHPDCSTLIDEFKNNIYILKKQNYLQRLFLDFRYVDNLIKTHNSIEVYYSYGIAFNKHYAKINILHLSNILPFESFNYGKGLIQKIKMLLLSYLLKNTFKYSDIISAESNSSFKYVDKKYQNKYFVSTNGNDDEINNFDKTAKYENTAVIVGTYSYKNISDSIIVYNYLKNKYSKNLHLYIIGDVRFLDKNLKKDKNITFLGLLPRYDVIEYLKKSKYYISSTLLENSYNAAAEGLFLSNEAFISNIDPHIELIKHLNYDILDLNTINCKIIHIKKREINIYNLKKWDNIIKELISVIEKKQKYDE
jgi:hypothetical protein